MWTGLIQWRILIDCLGVKTLMAEGDWWECCRYEKVIEMRLAVTVVLAVRIKCRLGGLSRSETRACLKIAFRQLCVTLCGRLGLDEGGVVVYAD